LRESRRSGGVVRAQRGERGGGGGAAILVLRVLPAHRARAFVEQLAARVCRRDERTDLAVEEPVAQQQRAARIEVLLDVVPRALQRAHEREALVVERARNAQI